MYMCGGTCVCFFFQAEDGIRDLTVTGVQTCCSSDLDARPAAVARHGRRRLREGREGRGPRGPRAHARRIRAVARHRRMIRSEEHTSELQSQSNLVCRLLLEKKNKSNAPSICLAYVLS